MPILFRWLTISRCRPECAGKNPYVCCCGPHEESRSRWPESPYTALNAVGLVYSELLLSAPARQARKHSTAVGLISGQGSRNSCWPSAAAPCFAAAKTASTTICANAAQSKSGVTQAAQVSPFGKLNCKTSTTSASKKSQAPSKSKAATPQAAQPAPIDSGAAAADPACPKASVTTVAQDADVMLNQTNIGQNNNKFYRMQLLQEQNADHWLWSRWGRVGDKGQTKLAGPVDAVTGYKEFKKLFR